MLHLLSQQRTGTATLMCHGGRTPSTRCLSCHSCDPDSWVAATRAWYENAQVTRRSGPQLQMLVSAQHVATWHATWKPSATHVALCLSIALHSWIWRYLYAYSSTLAHLSRKQPTVHEYSLIAAPCMPRSHSHSPKRGRFRLGASIH